MRLKTYVWEDVDFMRLLFPRVFVSVAIISFINIIGFLLKKDILFAIINIILTIFMVIIVLSYFKYTGNKKKMEEIRKNG